MYAFSSHPDRLENETILALLSLLDIRAELLDNAVCVVVVKENALLIVPPVLLHRNNLRAVRSMGR